ncbi:MAG: hypothetical protein R3C16_02650 [Hyphomonadaceae bacterium]
MNPQTRASRRDHVVHVRHRPFDTAGLTLDALGVAILARVEALQPAQFLEVAPDRLLQVDLTFRRTPARRRRAWRTAARLNIVTRTVLRAGCGKSDARTKPAATAISTATSTLSRSRVILA